MTKFLFLSLLSLISTLSFAGDAGRELEDYIKTNPISNLDNSIIKDVEKYSSRYINVYKRPESCPLASTKYLDILTKLEGIKLLFDNTCFKDFQDQFDAILKGARNLETDVNGSADSMGANTTNVPNVTDTITKTKINGMDINSVVGGLASIYSKNTCKIDNKSFFQKASDIITDVSSFGAMAPGNNGLYIQASSAAISSILMFLDSLFQKQFKFEEKEYRQSFIKLNCAFYSVRTDIENNGMLDITTDDHKADFGAVSELNKLVTGKINSNDENLNNILKKVEEYKQAYLKISIGQLISIEDILNNLKVKLVPLDGSSNEIKKLRAIETLVLNYGLLKGTVEGYINSSLATLPLFDHLFLKTILPFSGILSDETEALLNISYDEFNMNYLEKVNYHLDRIIKEIGNKKVNLANKFEETTMIGPVSLASYMKDLVVKKEEFKNSITKVSESLAFMEEKLGRITGNRDFNSRDDGYETVVNIIDTYNIVLEKIYGMVGYKFMKYTTNLSYDLNKDYLKKFSLFAKKYLRPSNNSLGFEIVPVGELSDSERIFACQDARPYRRMWKYSAALAEQGYDFIETNSDLFHSDVFSIYIKRPEFARNPHFITRWERLRRHHQSALYANKLINGEDVDQRIIDQLLNHKFLGEIMMKIHQSKKTAMILQDILEKYSCSNISSDVDEF